MKILTLLILFLLSTVCVSAQFTFTLRVKNTSGRPMPNVIVTALNSDDNGSLTATTDNDGKAVFTLTDAGNYSFNYLEMKNVASLEVKAGYSGRFTRSVTYDPKGIFAEKPKADRTGIDFTNVEPRHLRTDRNACMLNILVKETNRTLVPHVNISVVSIKRKTIYKSKTNAAGKAIFYLPVNDDYEIDVNELESYDQVVIKDYSGMEMTEVVFYEKTKVNEIVKGDTLIQNRIAQTAGTSSHVHFTLKLKDYDGNPLEDEAVYMKVLGGKRVYEGKTNAQGVCSLMLEKGNDYVLNLKHESGVYMVEAPMSKGFRTESSTRRYRGSKQIEKLVEEQKREMNRVMAKLKDEQDNHGQTITFHETPVDRISAPENYLTRTDEGIEIDFDAAGPAGTPTLIGNKMFSQEGLYSSNYFCLQAATGDFVWGLELGESGISPAVHHDGVLLINTASCTLYAIDANTGELLWSRWLATYVYSTPTAHGNSVYVVYSHGGYPVIVSFDLRTGNLNWFQPVDAEAIACPVVAGGEVHVASQSGMYYVFDEKSGKLRTMSSSLKVVSTPTITEDEIYVTATFGGTERLVVLDRETLELKKKYPISLTSLKISGVRNVDETDQMNFNGSHPIVYKNEVVLITDANKIRAFDMASEKLLWEQAITVNADQLPIVANDRVILTSTDGRIMSYNIKTGNSKMLKKIEGEIQGQPIARNGLLYIAAGGIIKIIKTLQRYEWNQWNKDATHNTYWKE